MLKKDVAEKLKTHGFDVDKLIAAIKSDDEQDYTLPELITATDLETRDTNMKAEGKREGVAEGKIAGKEIASKALAKKFNLPTTVDIKDLDKTIEAVGVSIASGDDGLKEQIKLLQKDKETLAADKEVLSGKITSAESDRKLIAMFPATRGNEMDDNERLMFVRNALTIDNVDGKEVVKKNGEVLRHPTTKDPLSLKDAVAGLFTERPILMGLNGKGAGRGGESSTTTTTTGVKTFSQATDQWKKDNPTGNIISPECTAYVQSIAKEIPDFDWHK